MEIIKKHWALIVFLSTVFMDSQLHILEAFIDSPKWVAAVRIIGIVALIIVNMNKISLTTKTRASQ